jgi:hypothetical protein
MVAIYLPVGLRGRRSVERSHWTRQNGRLLTEHNTARMIDWAERRKLQATLNTATYRAQQCSSAWWDFNQLCCCLLYGGCNGPHSLDHRVVSHNRHPTLWWDFVHFDTYKQDRSTMSISLLLQVKTWIYRQVSINSYRRTCEFLKFLIFWIQTIGRGWMWSDMSRPSMVARCCYNFVLTFTEDQRRSSINPLQHLF